MRLDVSESFETRGNLFLLVLVKMLLLLPDRDSEDVGDVIVYAGKARSLYRQDNLIIKVSRDRNGRSLFVDDSQGEKRKVLALFDIRAYSHVSNFSMLFDRTKYPYE